MNWDALGAIGEIFGAVAVVVTLLYLAKQISQANRISIVAGARELQQKYADFYTLVATNQDIKSLVTRLRDPDYVVQSEEEEEQIESFALLLLGIWQTSAIAYEQGQIDKNMYGVYCDDVEVKLTKWPGLRPHAIAILMKYPDASSHEIFSTLYQEGRAASA